MGAFIPIVSAMGTTANSAPCVFRRSTPCLATTRSSFVCRCDPSYARTLFTRNHRIRIANETELRSLYALAPNEQEQSLADLWSRSIGKTLHTLSLEERADLRRASFRTERPRALDNPPLRGNGLSDEAIEVLSVAWAYETDLGIAATEMLREQVEDQHGDHVEIVGGMARLPQTFLAHLRARPRCDQQHYVGTAAGVDADSRIRTAGSFNVGFSKSQRVRGDGVLPGMFYRVLMLQVPE